MGGGKHNRPTGDTKNTHSQISTFVRQILIYFRCIFHWVKTPLYDKVLISAYVNRQLMWKYLISNRERF